MRSKRVAAISAIAAFCVMGLGPAPVAQAGKDETIQCDFAGGLNWFIADAGDLEGNTAKYNVTGRNCENNQQYLGIWTNSHNAGSGMEGFLRLRAPAGAKITNVSVSARMNRDHNQRPQLYVQDEGGANQSMIVAGNTSGWDPHDEAVNADELILKLECMAPSSGVCAAPNDAFARIRNVNLTFSDSDAPAVFFGNEVLDGGDALTAWGFDLPLEVGAGSGIERFVVNVNETQVESTSYGCSPTSDPVKRTRHRACAPNLGAPVPDEPRAVSYTLDTGLPPFVTGDNEVEVCARDLATVPGTSPNEACVSTIVAVAGDERANVRLLEPLANRGKYFGYNGTGGTGYPLVTTLDVAGGQVRDLETGDPEWATANAIRSEIGAWFDVEPIEDEGYQLFPTLAFVNGALARGMTPIVQLYGPPAWARDSTCANPCVAPVKQANLDDWADYAAAMAAGLPEGTIFEIWNEPNFSTYWRQDGLADSSEWEAEPDRYAELARTATEAIHSVRPEATVLGGALSAPLTDGYDLTQGFAYAGIGAFLEDVFAAEPLLADDEDPAGLDGLSFHLYPAGQDGSIYLQDSLVPFTGNVYVNEAFAQVRDALAGADAAHLGLWIDEFGISTTGPLAFIPESSTDPLAGQRGALAAGVRAMLTMPDVQAVLIHRLIPLAGAQGTEAGLGVMGYAVPPDAKPAHCQLMYMASVEDQDLLSPCDPTPPAPTTAITPAGGGVQLSSNDPSAYFDCKFDDAAWQRCGPTLTAARLASVDLLKARAYLLTGSQDPTPAQFAP